jgi:hypothetical protein
MASGIKESDWREFKIFHPILLGRFSHQILGEIRGIVDGPDSCHARYLSLWKLIKKRDRQLGNAFNDYRRSTALQQLAIMRGMGLLADDELDQFSEETREFINRIVSVFKS